MSISQPGPPVMSWARKIVSSSWRAAGPVLAKNSSQSSRIASVSGQPMFPPPRVVSKLADIESIRSSVHLPWCRKWRTNSTSRGSVLPILMDPRGSVALTGC